jgi:hypothetical protein
MKSSNKNNEENKKNVKGMGLRLLVKWTHITLLCKYFMINKNNMWSISVHTKFSST